MEDMDMDSVLPSGARCLAHYDKNYNPEDYDPEYKKMMDEFCMETGHKTWTDFRAALIRDSINPDECEEFWKGQLKMWNCGIRDARMHDNALATLSSI